MVYMDKYDEIPFSMDVHNNILYTVYIDAYHNSAVVYTLSIDLVGIVNIDR